MSNRPALFLLVSVKVTKGRNFRLVLPLPVFVVYTFFEMMLDIADFASLFVPKNKKSQSCGKSKTSFSAVHSGMICAHLVIKDLFTIKAPWELCSIDTDDVKVKVKFY